MALLYGHQWRIRDFLKQGSVILLPTKRTQYFQMPCLFLDKTAPISIVFETNYQLVHFPTKFLLKHSKVSYTSNFLSFIATCSPKEGSCAPLDSPLDMILLHIAKWHAMCILFAMLLQLWLTFSLY